MDVVGLSVCQFPSDATYVCVSVCIYMCVCMCFFSFTRDYCSFLHCNSTGNALIKHIGKAQKNIVREVEYSSYGNNAVFDSY